MELQSLCPWCGKHRHPTRAAALASVRRQQRRDTRTAPRLRAYRCPVGLGWRGPGLEKGRDWPEPRSARLPGTVNWLRARPGSGSAPGRADHRPDALPGRSRVAGDSCQR